jgi:hypothetical protein
LRSYLGQKGAQQREKNQSREKAGAGVQGPHPLDKILGEKKGREFLDPRTTTRAHARTRALFKGGQNGKDHKNAAERIDAANYVRGFFLGYEDSKKARRLAGFSYLGGTGMDMLLTLLHKKRSSGAYPLATMVMGLLAPFTQPLSKRVCEHEPPGI